MGRGAVGDLGRAGVHLFLITKTAENKFDQKDFTIFYNQVSAYSNNFRFRSYRVIHHKVDETKLLLCLCYAS